ncbi:MULTISPECIES: peptidylprolyl isomerase [unclassified Thioalkalivibrio]|uniref:peptidylprolyl isomerase n=1 Tax=unclassified Thioalkalivibrio TaxID=2621013 RepID=UPI0003796C3E|nr:MULTISPECIES: peptidylprolyl isomerase [unclassified Thioalkalivibrio]
MTHVPEQRRRGKARALLPLLAALVYGLGLPAMAQTTAPAAGDLSQGAVEAPVTPGAARDSGAPAAPITPEGDRFTDRILAVVGDDVITQRELVERMNLIAQQMVERGTRPPDQDTLARQVMERLIVERVQLQEAERVGINIDEMTLNRAMENIARENRMTLPQLRQALMQDGVDFNAFREQIRHELTVNQLQRRQVDQRIRVSDPEIADLIASESGAIDRGVRYRIAQIMVPLPQGADASQIAEAREKAEALRQRVREGEDFATVAISESQGPQALEGGDLGWRSAGEIPGMFAREAVLMRTGEISEVLRSPGGFHIMKLLDREGGDQTRVQQTRVRHILISPDQVRSDEDARRQAQSLYNRIREGASFEDLARANSDDPGSAAQGGALGWVSPGELVPGFEEAMDALEPGVASEPVESQFGWHIIEVLERREVDTSREQIRARAREILQNRKREEELELWLRRLRDEAYVEYRVDGFGS